MYDVGQRVSTPAGEAYVLGVDRQRMYVSTDKGRYLAEDVGPVIVDREDLRDPETLEAWLKGETEIASPDIRMTVTICGCDCARNGDCCQMQHVMRNGLVLRQLGHRAITGACRCEDNDCECL